MALQVAGLPVEPEVLALLIPVSMALMIAGLLWLVRPPVTKAVMLSFAPWMVVGAAVHALYSVDAYPEWADPLFEARAVYFTTFVAAGMVWSYMTTASRLGGEENYDAQYVAAAGFGAALVTAGYVLSRGQGASLDRVVPAFGGLVVALVVAGVAYVLLGFVYSKAVVHTGVLGWLVVFGHALDATMTAIAVDVFQYAPLRAAGKRVIRFSADLPTAGTIGSGWLLVVVKVALSMVVVAGIASLLSRETFRERRSVAYIVLAGVAAYGLGPGIHNVLVLSIIG